MRNRSIGLTLFSGLAILVAACSTGGGTSPSAASAAPPASAPAASAASTEPSAAASGAPTSIVPTSASEYAPSIKSFVDQKFDVIVTVGFNLASATVQAAHDNPNTWFIGVDQSPICVTADGLPDATFACKGDAKTLLPKYISLQFQEDQAGYLAGIVAAGASKSGEIGAIGGSSI